MEARHLSICGLVQGVGFRLAMLQAANGYGVRGWVRNRSDGSVEALICGEAEAVARLIAWARVGPPGAAVRQVHVEHAVPEDHTGFALWPTV